MNCKNVYKLVWSGKLVPLPKASINKHEHIKKHSWNNKNISQHLFHT